MTTRSYRYLQLILLLRNSLLLDTDEYALTDTPAGLQCDFMSMQLGSRFQDVYLSNGALFGQQAKLHAGLAGDEIAVADAFNRVIRAQKIVQFDRLVRTLHLINHARHYPEQGVLCLRVHPYFVAQVHDHGRTFEKILREHQLPTQQILIEMQTSPENSPLQLAKAVQNYRQLGYHTAIRVSSDALPNLQPYLDMQPGILKLDEDLVRTTRANPAQREQLRHQLSACHAAGVSIWMTGIDSASDRALAHALNAAYFQGDYFDGSCP